MGGEREEDWCVIHTEILEQLSLWSLPVFVADT